MLPPSLLPLLLLVVVLLLAAPAVSQYAHGAHRAGWRLAAAAPLLQLPAASQLQCAGLCSREPGCRALQLWPAADGRLQCQLLAETACDGLAPLQQEGDQDGCADDPEQRAHPALSRPAKPMKASDSN